MTNNGIDNRVSLVMDAIRFPLIVLILYMHIVPIEPFVIHYEFTGSNIYSFLAEWISHNIGRLAVPTFFLISGYFYFVKLKEWNTGFYLSQQRKRIKTLVLPYVLWNVLNIILILAKGYSFNGLGMDGSGEIQYIKSTSLYELMISPINAPLWYLRDLICMTFLSPLFYYLFKYLKVYGIILLYIIYLTTLELPLRGFSVTAIFYFGLGAYWGIYKTDILVFCRKFRYPAYGIALVTSVLAAVFSTSEYHELMMRIFAPFGLISAIHLTNVLITSNVFRKTTLSLSGTVFFIYAVHELYLKNWVKGAFYRTPLSESGLGMILGYLIMPIVLSSICLLLYYIWRKISPKSLAFFTGGRI